MCHSMSFSVRIKDGWCWPFFFFFGGSLYCIVVVSISCLSLHDGCSLFSTAKFHFSFKKVMEPLYDNSAIRLKRCQIQTYAANFLRPRFNKPINYSMSFKKSFIYFTILSIWVSLLVCNTRIVCMFIWFLLPADSAWTNFL